MIKTLGEAAFSLAIAAIGLGPFLVGEWPETPETSEVSVVRALPVPDLDAVAPEPVSANIPNIYEEASQEIMALQEYETGIQEFANDIRDAFGINPTRARNFSEWITLAVESTTIPKEVMASLVVSESSFQYKLKSSVGAVGPAQVRPIFWAEKCGSGDLEHDPEFNIRCGVTVLSEYLVDICKGNMTCALQTYNVGPGNMKLSKYDGAKKRYIAKITRNMSKLTGTTMLAIK